MTRVTAILSGLVLLALAGCGSSSNTDDVNNPEPPVQGLLSPVSDSAVLEACLLYTSDAADDYFWV